MNCGINGQRNICCGKIGHQAADNSHGRIVMAGSGKDNLVLGVKLAAEGCQVFIKTGICPLERLDDRDRRPGIRGCISLAKNARTASKDPTW